MVSSWRQFLFSFSACCEINAFKIVSAAAAAAAAPLDWHAISEQIAQSAEWLNRFHTKVFQDERREGSHLVVSNLKADFISKQTT